MSVYRVVVPQARVETRMSNDVWYSRTALIWERPRHREEKSNHTQLLLSPLSFYWSEISKTAVTIPTAIDDNEICRLSYLYYLQYVTIVALKIRENLLIILSSKVMNNNISHNNTHRQQRVVTIPIAVAIPEGPWLPISIAAVHALNQPFLVTSTIGSIDPIRIWVSAVLLPLDPSDGYERLFHMLQDVRPAIVITASVADQERMKRIAQEISANLELCLADSAVPVECVSAISVINVNTLCMDDRETSLNESIRAVLLASLPQNCESDFLPLIWRCFYDAFDSIAKSCVSYVDDECVSAVQYDLRLSHIVFTSGSTGKPKGCVSSITSLREYITSKNNSHRINSDSVVLLASAISFDPCMSDILATLAAQGTLA